MDYIEVGRTAHQLERDHGVNAWSYAKRLADEAEAEGKGDEAEFWRAVFKTLEPRQSGKIPIGSNSSFPPRTA